MIRQGNAGYPVDEVMLHCAAIKTGQFAGMKPFAVWSTINRWHHERGFSKGFGYHGLFMPGGTFMKGRPWDMIGAGCKEKNRGVIHLLMIESTQIALPRLFKGDETVWLENQRFERWYTAEQGIAVRALIRSLPGIARVTGHNDYAPRLCPGFKVQSEDWL